MSNESAEEISKDTKKGIYKYKVKLLSNTKDVLIRPVCIAIPKITNITPDFTSTGCDQDSVIKITFNKAVDSDTFDPSCISIYETTRIIDEYFEAPKFTADGKTLYITPKTNNLILPPDGQAKFQYMDWLHTIFYHC